MSPRLATSGSTIFSPAREVPGELLDQREVRHWHAEDVGDDVERQLVVELLDELHAAVVLHGIAELVGDGGGDGGPASNRPRREGSHHEFADALVRRRIEEDHGVLHDAVERAVAVVERVVDHGGVVDGGGALHEGVGVGVGRHDPGPVQHVRPAPVDRCHPAELVVERVQLTATQRIHQPGDDLVGIAREPSWRPVHRLVRGLDARRGLGLGAHLAPPSSTLR